jgi:iron(III) transport system permease protein
VALVVAGSLLGYGLIVGWQGYGGEVETWLTIWAGLLIALGAVGMVVARPEGRCRAPLVLGGMGLYLVACSQIPPLTVSLAAWGRGLGGMLAPKIVTNIAEEIDVFFRPPLALLGLFYALLGAYAIGALRQCWRLLYSLGLIAMSYALVFVQEPLALVGKPYIIIIAYAVRSLPASVRAGIAALQQIDPAIEEASTNLGADTGYTFRHITLPLILPAFIAGLIFSFARHITSLSAIIFLTNPRWRILTALILSEVEQGGMSVAAAYSVLLIVLVFGAIGVISVVAGRAFRTEEGVDMALGAG